MFRASYFYLVWVCLLGFSCGFFFFNFVNNIIFNRRLFSASDVISFLVISSIAGATSCPVSSLVFLTLMLLILLYNYSIFFQPKFYL